MEYSTSVTTAERSREGVARRGPHCPICTGVLVPLREAYRCSRCFFTLCFGCEAPSLAQCPLPED
jgi:hypothetical protein